MDQDQRLAGKWRRPTEARYVRFVRGHRLRTVRAPRRGARPLLPAHQAVAGAGRGQKGCRRSSRDAGSRFGAAHSSVGRFNRPRQRRGSLRRRNRTAVAAVLSPHQQFVQPADAGGRIRRRQ